MSLNLRVMSSYVSLIPIEPEPQVGNNYILVSNNVYPWLGRWSKVRKISSLMKGKKVKKEYVRSSKGEFVMHQFLMGDESHPGREEILSFARLNG